MDTAEQSKRLRARTEAPPNEGEGRAEERLFLTAAEVGFQLGVRKSRVYELAAAGLLPAVRLGRRLLFPRRGLEELALAAIDRAKAECFSTQPAMGGAGVVNHTLRAGSSSRR